MKMPKHQHQHQHHPKHGHKHHHKHHHKHGHHHLFVKPVQASRRRGWRGRRCRRRGWSGSQCRKGAFDGSSGRRKYLEKKSTFVVNSKSLFCKHDQWRFIVTWSFVTSKLSKIRFFVDNQGDHIAQEEGRPLCGIFVHKKRKNYLRQLFKKENIVIFSSQSLFDRRGVLKNFLAWNNVKLF